MKIYQRGAIYENITNQKNNMDISSLLDTNILL